MAVRLLNLLPTVVLFLVLPGRALPAQEVGGFWVGAASNHVEFPTPTGLSGSVFVEHWTDWHFLVSLYQLHDATDKEGTVCLTYSPPVACHREEVHTTVELTGLRGGLVRTVDFGRLVRVGAGGGLSFNSLDAEATGVSGRPADLLAPNGGQIGAFGVFTLAMRPIPALPARVVGRFNVHWVNFSNCSGEDPPQYDPFCDPGTFRELEVGLSYAF